jgi:hypothetical protein
VDIALTDLGDTRWIIDHCCWSIRITIGLSRADLITALEEATAELAAEAKRSGWCPGQLPSPRTQDHRRGLAG